MQDYMRVGEAAAFLGISPNTLRNWGNAGKILTYRHPINGYRLYKKSELEALLASIELSTEREQGHAKLRATTSLVETNAEKTALD